MKIRPINESNEQKKLIYFKPESHSQLSHIEKLPSSFFRFEKIKLFEYQKQRLRETQLLETPRELDERQIRNLIERQARYQPILAESRRKPPQRTRTNWQQDGF